MRYLFTLRKKKILNLYKCNYILCFNTVNNQISWNYRHILQQECIPVGCVPSAAVAGRGGEGEVSARGCLAWWGRELSGQGAVYPRGVCPGGEWGCLDRGMSGQGVSVQRVSAKRGVSQHALGQRPPVDRILDTHLWKHYLSATTLLMVTNYLDLFV